MSLLLLLRNHSSDNSLNKIPGIDLKSVLQFHGKTDEGCIVDVVGIAWKAIITKIMEDKDEIYKIDPFKWEEILAGAYVKDGYDVTLTPRSGDHGRDIIAVKRGFVTFKIYDQMKAYAPGRVVPAVDVRAMLGTISGFNNVSKGIITTTSHFAPKLMCDPSIAAVVPNRVELRDIDSLMQWLKILNNK